MPPEQYEKFCQIKLLTPDVPAHILAGVALKAPRELSGGYYSYDSPELAAYQRI
jgi:hypothetical protein